MAFLLCPQVTWQLDCVADTTVSFFLGLTLCEGTTLLFFFHTLLKNRFALCVSVAHLLLLLLLKV